MPNWRQALRALEQRALKLIVPLDPPHMRFDSGMDKSLGDGPCSKH